MSTNKNGSPGPSPNPHSPREARRAHRRERKRAIAEIRQMLEEAEDMTFRDYDLCGRALRSQTPEPPSFDDVMREIFVPPGPLITMQGHFTESRLNRSRQVEPSRYTFKMGIVMESDHGMIDEYSRLLWRLRETLPEEEPPHAVELFSDSNGELQFVRASPSEARDSPQPHDPSTRNQEVGGDQPRWVTAGISRKALDQLSKISNKGVSELFREAAKLQGRLGKYSHTSVEVREMQDFLRQRAPTLQTLPSLLDIRKETDELLQSTLWMLRELERLGDEMLRSAREGSSATDDELQNIQNLIDNMKNQKAAWKAHKKRVEKWIDSFFKVLNRELNPNAQQARDGPDGQQQPQQSSRARDALRESLASLAGRKAKEGSASTQDRGSKDHGSKSDKQTEQGPSSRRLRGIVAAIGGHRLFSRGNIQSLQQAGSSRENQHPARRPSTEVRDQALLPGRPGHMLPARSDAVLRPQPAPSQQRGMNPSSDLSHGPSPAPSLRNNQLLQTHHPSFRPGSRPPPWRSQQASQSQTNPRSGFNAAVSSSARATSQMVPRQTTPAVAETTQRFTHLSMAPMTRTPQGATPNVSQASLIPPPLPPRNPLRQQQQQQVVEVVEIEDDASENRPASITQRSGTQSGNQSGNHSGDGGSRARRGRGVGMEGLDERVKRKAE